MKKFKKIFLFAIACVIFCSVFTFTSLAYDVSMDKYTINAAISANGDMQVTERMEFDILDDINGIKWAKDFSGTGGISDYRVYLADGTKFKKAESAQNGSTGVYTVSRVGQTDNMRIYIPSDGGDTRTISIEYTIYGAAKRYSDASQLYCYFVGQNWEIPIDQVNINITMPDFADYSSTKIWAHGNLTGDIQRSGNTVTAADKNLSPGDSIEIRILFPESALSSADKLSEPIVDYAVEEETQWANEANAQRQAAKLKVTAAAILTALAVIISIAIYVYVYIKYDKERKPSQETDYFRELPSNTPPAEVAYLYKNTSVGTDELTATLLDLTRRGFCTMRPDGDKKNYTFLLSDRTDFDSLTAYEQQLIGWLFTGDNRSFSTSKLKKQAKNRADAEKISKSYSAWIDAVKAAGEARGYYERGGKAGLCAISFIVCIAAALIINFVLFNKPDIISIALGLFLAAVGIFGLIYSVTVRKRTADANEEYYKWRAFRRFLKDFSSMDEAIPTSLKIWEHYLVYAVVLGVADEVIKQLSVKIPDDQWNDPGLTYMGMYMYMNHGLRMTGFSRDIITSSINSSLSSAISTASSTMSSGSGSGGGFSVGGGGGFGGGSGGGSF